MAVCGRLLVVCGRLRVVSSCILVVCGHLLVVCGRLCSFVVVACFSNYVVFITIYIIRASNNE